MSLPSSSSGFIKSSKDFDDKLKLPLRSRFRLENEETYFIGELEIRRHNGLYWRGYRTKTCVLLKNGRLFIYSDAERGLSINLFELRELKHKFENRSGSGGVAKARCELELIKGNCRIGISVKGSRLWVATWRRGFLCAQQGIKLGSSDTTDEVMWSQPIVDGMSCDVLFNTLANRSIRMNKSLPSLYHHFHGTNTRKQSRAGNMVNKLNGELSFQQHKTAAKNFIFGGGDESCVSELAVDTKISASASGRNLLDSGISSPADGLDSTLDDTQTESTLEASVASAVTIIDTSLAMKSEKPSKAREAERKAKDAEDDWKKKSRLSGIPMLSTDILNWKSILFLFGTNYSSFTAYKFNVNV